jgi:hypothetical protein
MLQMPFPTLPLKQSVGDATAGNMCDDGRGGSQTRDFIQHVTGTDECPVTGVPPATDIVKCQKRRHSQGLVIIQPAQIVVGATESILPPNLSHGDATSHPTSLDPNKRSRLHHNSATTPTADQIRPLTGIGQNSGRHRRQPWRGRVSMKDSSSPFLPPKDPVDQVKSNRFKKPRANLA